MALRTVLHRNRGLAVSMWPLRESLTMLRRATLAILLTCSMAALADEGEIAAGEPNCRILNMYPRQHERATWTGPCKNGYASGVGVLQWYVDDTPSSRYEGEMARGIMNGSGVMTYAGSDSRYEGEYRNGQRNGRGVLTQPGG